LGNISSKREKETGIFRSPDSIRNKSAVKLLLSKIGDSHDCRYIEDRFLPHPGSDPDKVLSSGRLLINQACSSQDRRGFRGAWRRRRAEDADSFEIVDDVGGAVVAEAQATLEVGSARFLFLRMSSKAFVMSFLSSSLMSISAGLAESLVEFRRELLRLAAEKSTTSWTSWSKQTHPGRACNQRRRVGDREGRLTEKIFRAVFVEMTANRVRSALNRDARRMFVLDDAR